MYARTLAAMALLLLAALPLQIARAQSPDDPFADDDRLKAPRTIHAVGQSMAEFLAQLSSDTGIRFTASQRVTEDKLVLIARDRPLTDSLRALSALFRFTWIREGKAGEYTYTLTQDLKQQKAEQEELDARYYRAADQMLREIGLVRSFEQKTPEELAAMRQEAEEQMRSETDAVKRAALIPRLSILMALSPPPPENVNRIGGMRMGSPVGRGEGMKLGAHFLAGITRDGLADLLKGGITEFEWPPVPGKQPLSTAIRDEGVKAVAAMRAANNLDPREPSYVRVRLDPAQGAVPALSGMVTVGFVAGTAREESGVGFRFPMGPVPEQADEPVEPPNWKSVEALTRPVSLPALRSLTRKPESSDLPPPLFSQALEAVDKSQPTDLVADAFYGGTNWILSERQGMPMGDALTMLSRGARHRWGYDAGFVWARSTSYAADRAGEPPVSSLRRWAALTPEKAASLDTLAEIADQPDPRYETTGKVLGELGVLERGVFMPRNSLIFWHALSPGQRSQAQSQQGLPYRALSPTLKRTFDLASRDLLAPAGMHSSNQERQWPPEELVNARLYVITRQNQMWGYREGQTHSAAGGESREAVLESLRKRMPGLTADQLVEVKSTRVEFAYRAPGGTSFMSSLSLPLVWSKPATQPSTGAP